MCFSAGASITAGVLLTFVGVETLRKVHKPAQLAFAVIPVFFAFQQFAEGALWLAMTHTGYGAVQIAATYIFLLLAQVIWPAMIPLSVLLIEINKTRRRILAGLLTLGSAIGLYNLYRMIFFGVHAEIRGLHLTYESSVHDTFGIAALALYLAVTIAPIFVSSIKRMYILGIIMFLSFVVSFVFYTQCLTSVWCFFAAVISFVIFYIIRDEHKKFNSAQGK
jgi:hypothetical protein